MRNLTQLGRGVALAALLALTATPANAGKEDRAKRAIAEAQGKIDAAEKAGTGGEVPDILARANAALRTAKEDLAADHNTAAIQAANRASMLADTAIGVANKARIEADEAQRADAAAAAAAAADQAAAANARASAAEQAAAAASAEAAALRNAPPPPTVAEVTTTETTKNVSARPAKKKVVRRVITAPARAASTEKTTTTTVTTAPATGGF